MPPDFPALDRPNDYLAAIYKETADDYGHYIEEGGEYARNYRERTAEWQQHYTYMNAGWENYLYEAARGGLNREKAVAAFVGLGLNPVGRDIGVSFLENYVRMFRAIIIIDFYAKAARQAAEDLVQNGNVERNKIYLASFDITDGYSTGYRLLIKKALEATQGRDQFAAMASRLRETQWTDICRCLEEYEQEKDFAHASPRIELEGRVNGSVADPNSRTLKFATEDGTELPVDLCFVPMVLGATGAGSEDGLWHGYNNVWASDVTEGGKVDEEERREQGDIDTEQQVQVVSDLYDFIASYNQKVAEIFICKFLRDNPKGRIIAATDVSTKYRTPSYLDEYDRLDLKQLKRVLRAKGILTHTWQKDWLWQDQGDHGHVVRATEWKLANGGREGSTGAKSAKGVTKDSSLAEVDPQDPAASESPAAQAEGATTAVNRLYVPSRSLVTSVRVPIDVKALGMGA